MIARRNGYFFTLDAFMAMGILTTGLVLVYLSHSFSPPSSQAEFFADDILETLGNTRLDEINSIYIDEQRLAGNITNMHNTILEQAGEFYFLNKPGDAQNFTANITASIVPPQYNYQISLNNLLLTNRSFVANTTERLSVSKGIVLGTVNTSLLWGPYTVEVLVWR